MKVLISYTLPGSETVLEDLIRWPDLSTVEEVTPHVMVYLEQKYGLGGSILVGIKEG